MRGIGASLVIAAATMVALAAFTAASVRAQDQANSQSAQQAQSPVQDQTKDQPADRTKDQPAGQAKDQAKDQAADQTLAPTTEQAHTQAEEPPKNPARVAAQDAAPACAGNPDAIGTSRVIAIDDSDYKRVGRMQYPDALPLNDKEVVLTFDDGPLPPYSNQILDILASQCVKATFFLVGEMARAFPATVRRLYEDGHTIGTHSDHHPTGFDRLPIDRLRREIDGGIADVSGAFGGDPRYLAPFFRIPGLERSEALESELAARGLIVFSADVVADDWHHRITPSQIIDFAIKRLEARGKGILLLHDIHPKTVAALPGLLKQLKDHGFHIVQVVPSAAYEIAMVGRPTDRMLVASALPGEVARGNGVANDLANPAWPKTSDERTSDDVALPAPDVAAFDPDTVITADSAAPQWPEQPPIVAAADGENPRPSRHKRTARRLERNKRSHVAETTEHRHHEAEHRHGRARAHAKTGTDGDRADLAPRVKEAAAPRWQELSR